MAAGRAPARRAAPAPASRSSPARRRPGQAALRGQQRYGSAGRSAGKAAALVNSAAPEAAPGCAIVSADWLLQLRDEVDTVVRSATTSPSPADAQAKQVATTPAMRPAASRVASGQRQGDRPQDRGPRPRHPTATSSPMEEVKPGQAARQTPGRSPMRALLPVNSQQEQQHMILGTDDELVTNLVPQGVRSQSTQTQELPVERIGGALSIGSSPPAQQQNSMAERPGPLSVGSQVASIITQGQKPTSSSPVRGPPAESPHGLGRCDLFGRDQDRAELERERRRLQAQMLAEQVEEQRKRKEEEKRKRQEEELLEDQRIERERRELEERHAREKGLMKNGPRSHANMDQGAPGGQGDPQPATLGGQPPQRRKRTPIRTDVQQEPQAGNTTAAESSRGFWAEAGGAADAAVARRRRRRRRTDASTGTLWRSGNQQSWRDPQPDSSGIPTQSRRQSQCPSPWLSETGQETPHDTRSMMREKETWQDQTDVLSTVRESSQEMRKPRTAEARQRRRRARERTREKDRQESRYVEQWMSPSAASARPPGEGTTSWQQDEEQREARYAGGRARRQRSSSHPQLDERVHVDGSSPLPLDRESPKLSDEKSLHQQLGSLVSLCEQLLKERAERDRADRERLERDRLDRMERSERTERSERSEHRDHSGRGDRSERGPQRSPGRKRASSKRLVVHDSQFLAPGAPGGEERWSPRGLQAVAAAAPNGGGPNSGRGSGAVSARSHGSQGAKARSHSGRSRAGHAGHGSQTHGEGGPDAANSGHRRLQPLSPDQYAMPVNANDWPPDALAGFMAEAVGHSANNIGEKAAAPRPRPRQLNDIESPSPFALPNARGIAVPRLSQGQGYLSRLVMSPPAPVSRGGLNLQAHWPAFGRSSIGPEDAAVAAAAVAIAQQAARGPGREAERQRGMYDDAAFGNAGFGSAAAGGMSNGEARMDVADWYQSPGPKHIGPGHIPIEIRPSIQAQSAMLRELYPRGPLAAGAAGPLPAP